MQVPLEVCREFGQFAYQDEQKGIDAIAAIQEFMEEYQDISIFGDDSQAKVINIEHDKKGTIKVVKSVKSLPNMQINLKKLITDKQEISKEATNFTTIVFGGAFSGFLMKVGAALYLIQFGIGLRTIKLKTEHGRVLVALYYLCRNGELNLDISVEGLQNKVQQNFNLSTEELDDILEDLVELRCISRGQNVIYLQEKIILNDK